MILIGQFDSPFVRRVAIALKLYGLAFEHRPWSTFGEGDKIAPFNPLRRVPTLVLDDGEALIESSAILDYLDELVGSEKAMTAGRGPQRRHALKTIALATGLGDKSVSLVYERVLRKDDKRSKIWVERCEAQIGGVLRCWKRIALASPRHTGSARKSVTPTSRSPARCGSRTRRIRNCSMPRDTRRLPRTPRAARRLQCSRKFSSR
jgi:Glutathione S-transferase, N-terminal domain